MGGAVQGAGLLARDHPQEVSWGFAKQLTLAIAPGKLAEFDRRVLWIAGGVFALLMALSPWYGFDRDELYFLDCARHLQAARRNSR